MLKKRLEKSWRQGQGLVPVLMKGQKKSMVLEVVKWTGKGTGDKICLSDQ